jgi:hypothetical protein
MNSAFTPIRRGLQVKKKETIWGILTAKHGSPKIYSQTASAAIKCSNAMIAKIMKVIPQDPSCMT